MAGRRPGGGGGATTGGVTTRGERDDERRHDPRCNDRRRRDDRRRDDRRRHHPLGRDDGRRRLHPLSLCQCLQLVAELAEGLGATPSRVIRGRIPSRSAGQSTQTAPRARARLAAWRRPSPRSPERFCTELKECGGDVTAGKTKRGPLFKGPQGRWVALGPQATYGGPRATAYLALKELSAGAEGTGHARQREVSDRQPPVVIDSDVRGVPGALSSYSDTFLMALSIERPVSFRLAVLACVTAAALSGCGGGTPGAPGAPAGGGGAAAGARAGGGAGGAGGRGGRGGPAVDVRATTVQRMSIQRMVDLAGTLMSPDQARVSAEAAGVVRAVLVEIGREVKVGDPSGATRAQGTATGARPSRKRVAADAGSARDAGAARGGRQSRRPTTRSRRSGMPTPRISTPRRPPTASTPWRAAASCRRPTCRRPRRG